MIVTLAIQLLLCHKINLCSIPGKPPYVIRGMLAIQRSRWAHKSLSLMSSSQVLLLYRPNGARLAQTSNKGSYSGSETLGTLLLRLGWDERDTSGLACGQDTPAICRSAGGRHVLIAVVKA